MATSNDLLDSLKLQLISATKVKLNGEREVLKLRHKERALSEELANAKVELTFLREQLEGVKDQLVQTKYQISMIEICKASEEAKISTHLSNLNCHKHGFQRLFAKERDLTELRNKELRDKEAEEEEIMRQQEKQVADKNEQQAREAASVEEECEAIEGECRVLKKRNNAIMLKLRRKLLETENARREIRKRNGEASDEKAPVHSRIIPNY